MDFFSFKFAAFVAVSLIAYHASCPLLRRTAVLPLANALFILSFAPSLLHLLPFCIFLLSGFALVRAVEAFPSPRNGLMAVGIMVLLFVYLKQYAFISFLPFLPGMYLLVGLSYVLFRIIHLLIDTGEGGVGEKVSFFTYLNYTCSFLTFVSGPIQRYQDYQTQERNAGTNELSQKTVFAGFTRVANGYLKIGILSALFTRVQQGFAASLPGASSSAELILLYAAACLCYAVYLYFNFSGYMDVVIGLGLLFGFTLPENFDRPFSSTSFLEFWSRWHITLSEWFKFYVFNPLLKTLTYRWSSPGSAPYLGVIAFFVVFLLMGVWHGSSYSFLLYGLFLGAGVSVNKLYEVEMRRRFGKVFYNALGAHPLYKAFGGALTFAYWSIALTCFWMDSGRMNETYLRLGIAGSMGVFAAGTLAVLIIMSLYSFGRRMLAWATVATARLSANYYVQQGFLSVKVLIILLLIKMNAAPEFVYKAF